MERPGNEAPGAGGASGGAEQRISDYLRAEMGVPEGEARLRARQLFAMAGVTAGAVGVGLASTARALVGNWWLFALRGLLAVVFGILALFEPLAALAALVLVFGVWAFIDGISALALAIGGWRSWQLLLGGLVGIAVGLVTFFRPGITALGLYAAVAAWSIARGILEIVVAIELRKEIEGEVWLILGGIASIVFGVLMVILPMAGVLALAWLIGVYALIFGAIQLALAVRLHGVHLPTTREPSQPLRPATL